MAYWRIEETTLVPDADINQIAPPIITQNSATSVSVQIVTINMTGIPTSYTVVYDRLLSNGSVDTAPGSSGSVSGSSNILSITGLTANRSYKFSAYAVSSTGESNKVIVPSYTLNSNTITPAATGGKTGASANVNGTKIAAKSYLKIDAGKKSDNNYTLAYKNFDAVVLPTVTSVPIGTGSTTTNSYSESYYSFGTSILLDSVIDQPLQAAGLGFFLNSSADSGYFLSIETVASSASLDRKSIRIFKLQGKSMKLLKDSQRTPETTLDSVFGNRQYNVDIKVKVSGLKIDITAYVNGFMINATDTTSAAKANFIVAPSKKVAVLGITGTSAFDYVYATSITKDVYDGSSTLLNFYKGQFSNDFLTTSYGDILYNSNNSDADPIKKPGSFDEFGTVVREIARRKIRFTGRPSKPVHWTTGGNTLARVIGESRSHFGSEVFVLNNSSVTVPLSDNGVNQLSIFGSDIGFSGEIEYSTNPVSEYSSREPVTFESEWLQNIKDVEALANWIRDKVINKSTIVSMTIFGNPLISVGDIVTIKYIYQGLAGTEKLIVTNVNHRYDQGLETNIVCRTL